MRTRQVTTFILFFCLGHFFGQEKQIDPEWVKTDSLNYRTILNVLADTTLVKDRSTFLKKIVPVDKRGKKDLGFGLMLFDCRQYGGYTTAWVRVLVFVNEIVQIEIRYDRESQKIIERLLKSDKSLTAKIDSINKGGPFLFTYENSVEMEKFKKSVAGVLGQPSNKIQSNDTDFSQHFNLLTNPLLNYEYGTRCYEGGTVPQGRQAINYFISSRDTLTIREILKGYNPEGRLYAVDGLLQLSKDKVLVLTNEDKRLLRIILTSKTLIRSCYGCVVSHDVAVNLIAPNSDFAREIEVIKKTNEAIEKEYKIRKEQVQPKKKGH